MLRHVASQGSLFAGFPVVFSVVELTIIMRYAFKNKAGMRVCQNSHPLLKYHKARTFTSSGFAIP